jgi:uncharacterized protein YciI
MYILSLTYKVDLKEIDKALPLHVQFLEKHYALGHFDASGRKVPRTGGIILSLMKDRTALEQVITEDPFYRQGLADYEIIEFVPSMTSTLLEKIKNQ